MNLKFRYIAVPLLASAIVGFFALVTFNISFLNPITQGLKDFSVTDIFYQVQQASGRVETNHAITIVDMTNLYKRTDIANALEEIEMYNPKTIGVDVVFEGLKDDEEGNEMLRQVAGNYDNIVFSHRLLDYENPEVGYTVDVHSFFADSIHVIEGYTNMRRELYGGIKRTLTLQTRIKGKDKPSFLAQVVRNFAGQDAVEASDEVLNINFTPTEYNVVSYDSIGAHPELIEDHVVLFGAMYEEGDMQYTPLGKMAGVKLLAYGAQTLLDQKEIIQLPLWLMWVITAIMVLITYTLQCWYLSAVSKIRVKSVSLLLSSDYFVGILLFFWMVILMGVSSIIFSLTNVTLNFGWVFAIMAFFAASDELFDAILELNIKKLRK